MSVVLKAAVCNGMLVVSLQCATDLFPVLSNSSPNHQHVVQHLRTAMQAYNTSATTNMSLLGDAPGSSWLAQGQCSSVYVWKAGKGFKDSCGSPGHTDTY